VQHLEPFSRVFGAMLARVVIDKIFREIKCSFINCGLLAGMSTTNTNKLSLITTAIVLIGLTLVLNYVLSKGDLIRPLTNPSSAVPGKYRQGSISTARRAPA
jgi:hypothetical protein